MAYLAMAYRGGLALATTLCVLGVLAVTVQVPTELQGVSRLLDDDNAVRAPPAPKLAAKPTLKSLHTELYTPAVKLPVDMKGKVFDGWLGQAAPSSKLAKKASGDSESGDDKSDDDDEGVSAGEPWYDQEHLADPPAGWHRPLAKKAPTGAKGNTGVKLTKKHKLTADETPEAENQFRGDGADASPVTIEEEVEEGKKPFGSGKEEASLDLMVSHGRKPSIAQKLHKTHRHISGEIMDKKAHSSDHPKSVTGQKDVPDGM